MGVSDVVGNQDGKFPLQRFSIFTGMLLSSNVSQVLIQRFPADSHTARQCMYPNVFVKHIF